MRNAMTKIRFAQVTLGDIDTILDMMRVYYEYDGLQFIEENARRRLIEFISDPALGWLWLIQSETETVGYVCLIRGYGLEHGRNALIDELFIKEEFRGQRYGEGTVSFLEEVARREGIESLHGDVERHNEKASVFWMKRGFRRYDRYAMVKVFETGT